MTRDDIAFLNPEAVLLEPAALDVAIIGMVERCGLMPVVHYSTPRLLLALMEHGMPLDDAREWFDYNVLGAYMGQESPVFSIEASK